MKKYIIIIATFLTILSLSGCQDDVLKANPEVTQITDIEGCTVKYVNRGDRIDSFFIATCQGATTVSSNYTQRVGKASVVRQSTVITKQIDDLQAELNITAAKEAAISKLSVEERKLLGF